MHCFWLFLFFFVFKTVSDLQKDGEDRGVPREATRSLLGVSATNGAPVL